MPTDPRTALNDALHELQGRRRDAADAERREDALRRQITSLRDQVAHTLRSREGWEQLTQAARQRHLRELLPDGSAVCSSCNDGSYVPWPCPDALALGALQPEPVCRPINDDAGLHFWPYEDPPVGTACMCGRTRRRFPRWQR